MTEVHATTTGPDASLQAAPTIVPSAGASSDTIDRSTEQLSALVDDLESTARANPSHGNSLIGDRWLDVARTLFAAIRHKHAPTAGHSLRVALGCSTWAEAALLSGQEREELEVAALLHDVGKLGAPDRLLLQPGALAPEDARLMDEYRLSGLEILADSCPSRMVMEITRHSAAWFDGSRPNYTLAAEAIPRGARMLAIVDAFDSMTSDQVYRRAMSRERALNELFTHAGTQFDPDLVKAFNELQMAATPAPAVPGHWLRTLDPNSRNRPWPSCAARAEPCAIGWVVVPAEAARQHARCGDFCRQPHANPAMEPRRRTIDRNRRLERGTAHLVADVDRHARREYRTA